ncbi:hypothetical protein P3H15_39415 [Rhodococcus sp. T2V]|nr:hypothetical protein [Rhodococcus sp. T2V]MDF3311070.1 hypothetical protein [Rhodococcus sp. T2V]
MLRGWTAYFRPGVSARAFHTCAWSSGATPGIGLGAAPNNQSSSLGVA